MSMINFNLDDGKERQPLPAGDYHIKVNQADLRPADGEKRPRIVVGLEVVGPTAEGYMLFTGLSLPKDGDEERELNDGRTMFEFLLSLVKEAATALGVEYTKKGFNTDDFIGREAIVSVALQTGDDGVERNNVTRWREL